MTDDFLTVIGTPERDATHQITRTVTNIDIHKMIVLVHFQAPFILIRFFSGEISYCPISPSNTFFSINTSPSRM